MLKAVYLCVQKPEQERSETPPTFYKLARLKSPYTPAFPGLIQGPRLNQSNGGNCSEQQCLDRSCCGPPLQCNQNQENCSQLIFTRVASEQRNE